MKRVSLLSLIILIVFTNHLATAQSKFKENMNFGIKAGFNWTSSNDEDRVQDYQVNPRPGFNVGGLANYRINAKWALQTEVTYSKEGAAYDFPGNGTIPSYIGKTDLNFINVPLLVQYMIFPGFRVQAGGQFGYATSINYEDDNNKESENKDIQKGNASFSFGFGYLTKSGLGFDIRYNGGLSNMYKEGIYPGQTALTRAGQLGFFYQFK